jgi:hypothetical protein
LPSGFTSSTPHQSAKRGTRIDATRESRLEIERARERRRHLGEDFALRRAALVRRDVAEDEDDAAHVPGSIADRRAAAVDRRLDAIAACDHDRVIRQADGLALAEHARHGSFDALPRRLVDRLEHRVERLAFRFVLRHAGELGGDRIHEDDPSVDVRRDHGVANAPERRIEAARGVECLHARPPHDLADLRDQDALRHEQAGLEHGRSATLEEEAVDGRDRPDDRDGRRPASASPRRVEHDTEVEEERQALPDRGHLQLHQRHRCDEQESLDVDPEGRAAHAAQQSSS